MDTRVVATRMDVELAEKLDGQARSMGMLLSEYVRVILSAWASGEIDALIGWALDQPRGEWVEDGYVTTDEFVKDTIPDSLDTVYLRRIDWFEYYAPWNRQSA